MLQRLQTVLLLGVIALLLSAFFFPFFEISTEDKYLKLSACKETYKVVDIDSIHQTAAPTFITLYDDFMHALSVSVALSLCVVVAVITLLFYKKRATQSKLCLLLFLWIGGLLAFILFYKAARDTEQDAIMYGWGTYALLITLPLTWWTRLRIKKDELLVKASERLR